MRSTVSTTGHALFPALTPAEPSSNTDNWLGFNRLLRRALMKTRSPFLVVLAILVTLSITIPPESLAQTAQKAGEVSRAIPDVNLSRGSQQLPAAVKTLVDWGD